MRSPTPLAGLTAAALALTAPGDDAGVLWDIAMTDVIAGTLDGTPSGPAHRHGKGWVVDTTHGPVPVARPRARPVPVAPAPDVGADTGAVLAELGIRC
jgi:hypothetical protein